MKIRISLLFEENDAPEADEVWRLHFVDGSYVDLTHTAPSLDALPERFEAEQLVAVPPGPQQPAADNT